MRKAEWIVGLAYVGVLAVLPLAGQWARGPAGPTCAHDGGRIDSQYRVRIVDEDGRDFEFCSILCAEQWLHRQKTTPRAVWVTDESSGTEIEAASAFFVRSPQPTTRTTLNRVHAFRKKSDAESHARLLGGRLLDASERPFGGCPCCPECRDQGERSR
jgi:hypothetical protein